MYKFGILFLHGFKLGHGAAYRNIRLAFEEDSMDERIVRFQKFRSGNGNLENEPRGGPKSILR